METSPTNRQPMQDELATDPLLWHVSPDRYLGHDIVRVDVAAEGPRVPLPPGVDHLPGPGEIVVSPAMARLLSVTDPAQLGNRYPGRVIGTVGSRALASSDALVVFVGHAPADLRTSAVAEVRSIEGAPVDHGFTIFLRVILVLGALGLLIPIVVFVSTTTRLAAARREQRLAALRLAGATPGQTIVVATVEAALAAVVGSALGFVIFVLTRPAAARVPFDGAAFYVSDLELSVGWTVAMLVGVPVLAMTASIVSLRKVQISPLGITTRARRSLPRPRRLLLVGAGALVLALAVSSATRSSDRRSQGTPPAVYLIGVAFVAIIVGIVLAGPWLTTVVARLIDRFGRRAPALLAARRLEDNPTAAFRSISGLTLAVFIASVFAVLAAAGRATASGAEFVTSVAPSTVVSAWSDSTHRGIDPTKATALTRRIADVAGSSRSVRISALPDGTGIDTSAYPPNSVRPGVVDCRDATAMGLPACTGTVVLNLASYVYQKDKVSTIELYPPIPQSALADLPVAAIAVFTDGQPASIERVRTALEAANATGPTVSGSDIGRQNRRELAVIDRLTNAGLGITLLIAGCSLAVAVAGGIIERTRPFALLRLSGMRRIDLHRVVLAESAGPLTIVAMSSAAAGQLVAAVVLIAAGRQRTYELPPLSYWLALLGGLALALVVVAATLPLLDRLTDLDSVRFE